jgi:glycosyltransferase involved in cell wall biosynthesis
MPCLNEARSLKACITKAQSFLTRVGRSGEILICDNGSTDGSVQIAHDCGATVVLTSPCGYGCAIRGGLAAAQGRYLVIGDADDSYDFSALDPFISQLDQGYEMVIGNRFRGGIEPGAMPWMNRYLGNPVLSFMGRLLFGCTVGDLHCGLRAISKEALLKLQLSTAGMEFASEMIVDASQKNLKTCEVPVQLFRTHPERTSHLRPFQDGLRHIWLMMRKRWDADF